MARKQTKKAITGATGNKKKISVVSSNRRKEAKAHATKASPKSRSPTASSAKYANKKGNRAKKQQPPPSALASSEDEESVTIPEEEEEYENLPSSRKDKLGDMEEKPLDSDGDEKNNERSDEEDEDEEKQTGFTDENAKWLKPKLKEATKQKSQLLSSDDEDDEDAPDDDEFHVEKENEEHDGEEGNDDEEDDDEDEEEELEVERQSRLLDEDLLAQQAEADQELRRTIAENTEVFHLPTKDELDKDNADRVVPPSEVKNRVESILEVLADFKNRREEGRSRSEYVEQLISDIAELHGYLPELIEYFHSMFGPSETLEFVDASDKPRPLVIRTNTLKARRKDLAAALMKRGVTLDPLAAWSKVGLKITESPVPIGATPEYLSGMYMLQSAASMCPVMALSPELKEKVLDMSAAPGGKTSYIAQLMRNTGVIFANDLKAERQKATVANLHRLGVKNVIACALDGRKLGKMFRNRFDRILLDAPCSGLGVISRDPSVKIQRTITDVQRCAHLQKELLLAAIDALNHKSKTGGVMVYSTCSVSVAENEEVISYALSKRDIKIIDTGLDFGK
jgi:ribosomal RNA methyltransferase Nop2